MSPNEERRYIKIGILIATLTLFVTILSLPWPQQFINSKLISFVQTVAPTSTPTNVLISTNLTTTPSTSTSQPITPTTVAMIFTDTPTPLPTSTSTPIPLPTPTLTSIPVTPTKLPTPAIPANTPISHISPPKSWITCDKNMQVLDVYYFKWAGPDAGNCTVSLQLNDVVVGTADRFQDKVNAPPEGTKCVAFLLKGPLTMEIAINRGGGGDFHAATTPYDESWFTTKWQELDKHAECNPNKRGYEKITCTEAGCTSQ